MTEHIYIYHTNDLHSHFENWPRIQQYVLERKKEHSLKNETVFTFDIGDHTDRWHPYTEGTKGKGNVRLLNEANFDAVTIGNNEGITFSYEDLNRLYQHANFDIIIGNLFQNNKKRPHWAKPYKIYETKQKAKIAVIGLTADFTPFYEKLGWKVTDPHEELAKILQEVENQANIIILLSHLGLPDDEEIAKKFPMIDVIIGAHTHHVLENGMLVNNCLLSCAGKFGNYIGKIELEYDFDKKSIIRKSATLIPQEALPMINNENLLIQEFYEIGKSYLEKPIAYLPNDLLIDWDAPSDLAILLCDSLLEWCNAHVAFLNSGLILNRLKQGIVTEYDVHNICPHPINPCIVYLTGEDLEKVILQTLDTKWATMPLKGLGFRGERLGIFVYSGIQVIRNGTSINIYINDELIDLKQKYKVAIPDLFGFAKFFPEIYQIKEKEYLMPEFMRDLLKRKLNEEYPVK